MIREQWGDTLAEPMKQVFWLASYPRSGNTWIRLVLSRLLFNAQTVGEAYGFVPDPYKSADLIDSAPTVSWHGQAVSIVKTHSVGFPKRFSDRVAPPGGVGGLYLIRHPLDVFLSQLNFAHVRNLPGFFINGKPKPVKQIIADGEMDAYLDRFISKLGFDASKHLAGSWLENVESWQALAEDHPGRVLTLRYEDLVADTNAALRPVAELFDKSAGQLADATAFADEITSDGGKFFWRKGKGGFAELLTPEQIVRFEHRHAKLLRRFGY